MRRSSREQIVHPSDAHDHGPVCPDIAGRRIPAGGPALDPVCRVLATLAGYEAQPRARLRPVRAPESAQRMATRRPRRS